MKTNNPLFSIVIVNYNGAEYLETAITSILSQNNHNYELIIVDGGSTDKSVEIIKKYENRLSWWISEKDDGQSDAFNKGFAKAKGKFYFWINADDLLLPNSLKYAEEAIKKNPSYKWFAANTIFIDEKNRILKCARGPIWKDFFIKNGIIYVSGPTSIFHKDLLHHANGFDVNLHYTMDGDLWMKFKNEGYKFKRINKYFWAFRIHSKSKTSHSFNGVTNEAFKQEQMNVRKKNGYTLKKSAIWKQKLWKLISGSIFLSKIDSFIYQGKKINTIF